MTPLLAKPPRRILVMAREHLGDVCNITGALLELHKHYPEAEITLEAGEGAIEIARNSPAVTQYWPRLKHQGLIGRFRVLQRIRQGNFDLGVAMDDSNTHIALMKLGGVRRRVGVFRSRHHKWFDYSVRPKRDGHDTFSWLYPLLEGLGIRDPNLQPKLFPPAIDFPSGLVGISLGASVRAKQWPTDSFERLVDLLNLPCIGFAGPGQEDLCPHNLKLAQGLDHPLKLAAAIGQCRVLVTADSGPAHIAAAMGTPAVVLYGPTDSVRFAPFGTKHTLLREANTCDWNESVCIDAKNGVCQQSCMRAIRPEVVAQAVLARIKTD